MMADFLRWSPFDDMHRLAQTFTRLVDRSRSGSACIGSPYASIGSGDDGCRVRIPLPGIAPENVTVDVTGRSVHVRAIEHDGDTEVTRYEKVLTLPASVDAKKAGATFRHGLPELMLPYQEAVKPRRIEIATEEPKHLPEAA